MQPKMCTTTVFAFFFSLRIFFFFFFSLRFFLRHEKILKKRPKHKDSNFALKDGNFALKDGNFALKDGNFDVRFFTKKNQKEKTKKLD